MSVARGDKKIEKKGLQTFPLTLILQIIKPNPNLFLSAVFYWSAYNDVYFSSVPMGTLEDSKM